MCGELHGESPQSAGMRKAGDATFLVLYNQVVEKYPFYALDRAGALQWEQDVNPKYVRRFVGGCVWHQVDVEVGNGMVWYSVSPTMCFTLSRLVFLMEAGCGGSVVRLWRLKGSQVS